MQRRKRHAGGPVLVPSPSSTPLLRVLGPGLQSEGVLRSSRQIFFAPHAPHTHPHTHTPTPAPTPAHALTHSPLEEILSALPLNSAQARCQALSNPWQPLEAAATSVMRRPLPGELAGSPARHGRAWVLMVRDHQQSTCAWNSPATQPQGGQAHSTNSPRRRSVLEEAIGTECVLQGPIATECLVSVFLPLGSRVVLQHWDWNRVFRNDDTVPIRSAHSAWKRLCSEEGQSGEAWGVGVRPLSSEV